MDLIKYLQTKAPIREGEQFYNLYKADGEKVTYSQLSELRIEGLQIADNEKIFFLVENEPNF